MIVSTVSIQNNVEYHCCLFPTAVLISPNDLKSAYLNVKKNKLDAIVSVIENQTFFRSFIKKKKYIRFVWEKKFKKNVSAITNCL